MNLLDILQYIDSQKRQASGLLSDVAQNPMQGLRSIGDRLNYGAREWNREMDSLLGSMTSVRPDVQEVGLEGLLNVLPTPAGMTKAQAAKIIKDTARRGGSTTDLRTGSSPKTGYSVATTKEQTAIPVSELRPKDLVEFARKHNLDRKGLLGTWVDDGKVYLDPVENVKSPFAARLEADRRKQLAAWNFVKGDIEQPSIDAGKRIALRDAKDMTAKVEQQPMINVPEGPEFWPWRVKPGGYEAAYDDKKQQWFTRKVSSPDEKKLQKSIKEAEDWLAQPGNNQPVYDLQNLYRPEQQNQTLAYATRPKGVPDWIADQYGDDFKKLMKEKALAPSNPNAWKFYWTGPEQDEFFKAYGKEKGQEEFQKLMSNMGATTSGARPAQNVRSATYHWIREGQGLPLPVAPPYPYGHNKYGTHLNSLNSLLDNGGVSLPPGQHPKGATFAGNLSGQTSDATMDEVMTTGHGLLSGTGAPQMAPFEGTYGVPVQKMREVTKDLKRTKGKIPQEVVSGLTPMDVQSKVWAELGGTPSYAKPLLEHLSDRAQVTSRVTGLPVAEVMRLLREKKMPLLGVGAGLLGNGYLDAIGVEDVQ